VQVVDATAGHEAWSMVRHGGAASGWLVRRLAAVLVLGSVPLIVVLADHGLARARERVPSLAMAAGARSPGAAGPSTAADRSTFDERRGGAATARLDMLSWPGGRLPADPAGERVPDVAAPGAPAPGAPEHGRGDIVPKWGQARREDHVRVADASGRPDDPAPGAPAGAQSGQAAVPAQTGEPVMLVSLAGLPAPRSVRMTPAGGRMVFDSRSGLVYDLGDEPVPTVTEDGTVVLPDGIRVRRDGTIEVPGDVRVLPNRDVVAPNGDVIRPDGIRVRAGGTRIRFEYPEDPIWFGPRLTLDSRLLPVSIPVARGRYGLQGPPVLADDGTRWYPDGRIEYRNGKVEDFHGTIRSPYPHDAGGAFTGGTVLDYRSRTVLQDGSRVSVLYRELVDGTKLYTDGLVMLPDGTQVVPDGRVVWPNGIVVLVDGGRLIPKETLPAGPPTEAFHVPAPSGDPAEGPPVLDAEGRLVDPGGTVVYANGTIEAADGTRTLANGIIVSPGGLIRWPDRTVGFPGALRVLADGRQELQDGTQVLADDSMLLPSGERAYPDGSRDLPGGARLLAGGTWLLDDGTVVLTDLTRVYAGGWVESPDGAVELLDAPRALANGTTVHPGGRVVLAGGRQVLAGGAWPQVGGATRVPPAPVEASPEPSVSPPARDTGSSAEPAAAPGRASSRPAPEPDQSGSRAPADRLDLDVPVEQRGPLDVTLPESPQPPLAPAPAVPLAPAPPLNGEPAEPPDESPESSAPTLEGGARAGQPTGTHGGSPAPTSPSGLEPTTSGFEAGFELRSVGSGPDVDLDVGAQLVNVGQPVIPAS